MNQNTPSARVQRECSKWLGGLLAAALCASAPATRAANGTWTNDASSIWSDGTNWLDGSVASGVDAVADFSTITITTNRFVTLNVPETVGSAIFGNAGTLANTNWFLNSSGGSVLTLATSAGSPTVNVTNIAVVSAPLGGTQGLTKVGNGTLVLAGTNSYTGNTVVNSGTLKLTNTLAGISTTDPVLYMSFDDVSGAAVINQGSGGAVMNGTLFGGAAIVPGGRYGNALRIPAGNSTLSYVLINNAVVPLNGAAGNNWTVAMWVNTSTAGGVYLYQGSGGWVGGNTEFYLENGTQGDGAGTHQGGVRNSQAWVSGTATVNDGNWHFLVMTCTNAVRTMYFDGALDATLSGAGSWGGNGVGAQIRIGGSASTADSTIGLNGLIDEVYMYNRALSAAEVVTLMNSSSGSTSLASPLPPSTSVSVAPGAKLDLNSHTPMIAGLTGSGFVDTSLGSPTLVVNDSSDSQFDGNITNSVNTVSLTKVGAGKLTLSATNTYSGATTVNAGTLNITGMLAPISPTAASLIVGNGIVSFSGSFMTNLNFNIATATNSVGAFYHTAGTVKQTQGANGANFQLGSAPGAYGYYYIGAGATNFCNEVGVGGEVQPSGNGYVDVNGGVLLDSGYVVVCRNGGGNNSLIPQFGVVNVYPGSLMTYGSASGQQFALNWGANQNSVVNIMGGLVTNTFNNITFNLNNSGTAGNVGILNLNAGILQAGWVSGGVNGTRVNFNGGTLQAAENQAVMMQNLSAVTVYSGGGTFNNNGYTITIGQQLVPPTGNGISGIASFTGGAGYIAPPIVTVVNDPSDFTGVGATAIAQIDPTAGTVTNVIITCPGVNYTVTPAFVLTGGGATTPATITGATPTPTVSGGMTFAGTGTVTLTGGFTYTGPTTVSGGTLTLAPATVTPSVPGDLVINGGTVNVPSTNATTLPVGNLKFQTSGSLNIAFGTVFLNPTVAAVTASAGITIAPTNIINVTGFGLKPGTITLIKYATGTVSSSDFANIGYTLPPGVVGTLVNNTANQSIDLNITSSPNQLTWSGVGGVNWDLSTFNWTNNANGLPAVYQQYTNGSVIAGDGVRFDDTLTNDFVNPQPTNVNITVGFTPFPVTVDSTLAYSISGPGGITGIGNFVKNNTGSLTLLTSNSFSGGMAVNGGSVIVTNDSALGTAAGTVALNSGSLQINGNTTNNSRVLTLTGSSTIGVSNSLVARLGGTVTGSGALTKTDLGSLTLAGNDTMTGALTVNQGTLTTLGTDNLPAVVTVGNTGGQDAILNVGGGTFNALNNGGQFVSGLVAGSAGGSGDIRLSAGTLTVFQQFGLGSGNGGYAGFSMTGGTLISGGYIVVGFNNDNAVFNQSAGTATVTTNLMTIAAGGTAATGVANLNGGTFISTDGTNGNNGGRGGIFIGETGNGTLNVSGTATVTATGQANLTMGRTGAPSAGTVNLLGGTVNTSQVSRGAGSATLNFNGGVLKATGANTAFINGLNAANVYNGGAIIDDGGFNITIPQALQAPNGFGIATIPVVPGTSSGYIDTPIVSLFGGNGSNALATATVSGGQITAVTVTSPGSGYLNTDILSVTFIGGGANAVQPQIGTIAFVANGAGGLTKRGAGALTLSGVNTFTGPITNSAGTLSLNSASTYIGALVVNAGTVVANTSSTLNGPTIVTNGATLTITQIGTATNKMSDLTFNGTATLPGATLGLGLTGQNPATPLINCGVLTLNGTNTISLSGAMSVGAIPLIKYTSKTGSGSLTNLTLPQGVVGSISNGVDSIIYALITSTGPGLVWSGTNSSAGLTNLWDIASTTNWLLGATTTTYRQPIIPGDAVTFNDVGSGTVILNTNAGPSSVTFSNNAVTYNITGRGNLTGSGGITKLGTGTAILTLTNDNYTGDTTISNGVLQVGTTTALSSAANLNIGTSGTLELPGLSQAVNNLFGQGTVDNNTTTNVTLTLNNGGTWNGTIHDQGAGGGVSLTKIGNGTLVVGGSNYMTSPTASQVNAGLTIVTNGGSITCVNSEYWVGAVGGLTATNIVDGGTVTAANNFLVIGRGSANAVGTLIVNSGTVQKSGANVIVVGSLGATGTLIVNGGQVLNNSELWLGENATAVANLYLNGGLLQATDIRANGTFPSVQPAAYFNGGTLQAMANSADFLQVNSYVMSNGMVFDDNGFTDTIALVPLIPGDSGNGGLIKKGSGTLYLDNFNTYTGDTLVTNGMLAGVGGVVGNVIVAPNGNLGAGNSNTIGSFTIGGSLNIQGKATVRVNKTGSGTGNDQITGYTSVHFGGILVVTNATSDATPITTTDTFQIFSTGGTGNFTNIQGTPGPGLAYSFNPATGVLSVVTSAPAITGLAFTGTPVISGSSLTISGTNAGSGSVYLLTSTNIASPLNTWLPVWTNVFTGDSSFTTNIPNAVDSTQGKQFFILGNTHN
jgi:autotransporter-associated beta strand protein